MTRREQEKVRKAILAIMHDEGNFAEAIDSLCRMVGWKYPAAEFQRNTKSMPVHKIIALMADEAAAGGAE